MENKLLALQKALKPIKKDSENPFHKSKYFDINSLLEAVKPELDKVGLLLTQPILINEGKMILVTSLVDGDKEVARCEMILPEHTDPQKTGSCITYYRRYSLQSLLALEAEDDDANVASGHTQVKTTPQPVQNKAVFNENLHQKVSMPTMDMDKFKETARKFEALGGGYDKGFFLPTKLAEEYKAKHEAKAEIEYPFDMESSQSAMEEKTKN